MTLTKEDIAAIQQMYLNEYHRPITPQQAEEIGRRLLQLFEVIGRPVRK